MKNRRESGNFEDFSHLELENKKTIKAKVGGDGTGGTGSGPTPPPPPPPPPGDDAPITGG